MAKAMLRYNSRGSSGNIYWIFGAFISACVGAGLLDNDGCLEVIHQAMEAGSYEAALAVLGEYAELIDEAGMEVGA